MCLPGSKVDPITVPTSSRFEIGSVAGHNASAFGGRDKMPTVDQSRDALVVEEMETSILLDQSTTDAENERDDASLFQVICNQGDGTTSELCHHCQWIIDHWSKYLEDEEFNFPHYEDTFQLENAAIGGCALCYQFWRHGSIDVQRARDEMDGLGRGGYEACDIFR
jgi:hypothetical protein